MCSLNGYHQYHCKHALFVVEQMVCCAQRVRKVSLVGGVYFGVHGYVLLKGMRRGCCKGMEGMCGWGRWRERACNFGYMGMFLSRGQEGMCG